MASLGYMNLIRWDRPDRSEQFDGRQPSSEASRLPKSSGQSIGLPFVLYIFKSPAIRPLSWKLPPPSCPCGKVSTVSQPAISSSFTDLLPRTPNGNPEPRPGSRALGPEGPEGPNQNTPELGLTSGGEGIQNEWCKPAPARVKGVKRS